MMRVSLVLAGLLSLGFAPAPFPKTDTAGSGLQKLQGSWVKVRSTIGGMQGAEGITVVIDKDQMHYFQHGRSISDWVIKLDATRTPKVFDIQGSSPGFIGRVFRGIYRIEGKTMTICSRQSENEKDRPTDFTANKPGVWVEVFQRSGR